MSLLPSPNFFVNRNRKYTFPPTWLAANTLSLLIFFLLLMPVFVWHLTSVRGILYLRLYFNFNSSDIFYFAMQMALTFIQLRDSQHYKFPFAIDIATMCMFISSMELTHTKCQMFTKLSPNYPKIKWMWTFVSFSFCKYGFILSQSVNALFHLGLESGV